MPNHPQSPMGQTSRGPAAEGPRLVLCPARLKAAYAAWKAAWRWGSLRRSPRPNEKLGLRFESDTFPVLDRGSGQQPVPFWLPFGEDRNSGLFGCVVLGGYFWASKGSQKENLFFCFCRSLKHQPSNGSGQSPSKPEVLTDPKPIRNPKRIVRPAEVSFTHRDQ